MNIDAWLSKLSATRVQPVGRADENVAESQHGGEA